MTQYILIKNGAVENIVEADDVFIKTIKFDYEKIIKVSDTTGSVGIGDVLHAETGEFIKPVSPPEKTPVPVKKITRFAFVTRFTDTEAVALDLVSRGNTVQEAFIRRYLQKIELCEFVDLGMEDTINGAYRLEEIGLLAKGRAKEIIEAPVLPEEIAR